MGGLFGNSTPSRDYAGEAAAAKAEADKIKAEQDKEQAANDQKLMAEKTSLAAKEAASKQARRQLLAGAGLGDDTEDPLNPSTRKKKTGSLLSGAANANLDGLA
jgi:hypothetical protein